MDGFPGRLTLEDLQNPHPGQSREAYSHPEQRVCACDCRVKCCEDIADKLTKVLLPFKCLLFIK